MENPAPPLTEQGWADFGGVVGWYQRLPDAEYPGAMPKSKAKAKAAGTKGTVSYLLSVRVGFFAHMYELCCVGSFVASFKSIGKNYATSACLVHYACVMVYTM